jgi:hypothetical protein
MALYDDNEATMSVRSVIPDLVLYRFEARGCVMTKQNAAEEIVAKLRVVQELVEVTGRLVADAVHAKRVIRIQRCSDALDD